MILAYIRFMITSKSSKAAWVAAFFDGEGCVYIRSNPLLRRHIMYRLSVSNTEPVLAATYAAFLYDLGIETMTYSKGRQSPKHKPLTIVDIRKAEAILRFARLIPLQSELKSKKLAELVGWINRDRFAAWSNRKDDILRLWHQGHSARCIVRQLGLKPGSHTIVGQALTKWGIEVSPHGRMRPRCGCPTS